MRAEPDLNALASSDYLVRLRGIDSLVPWDARAGRLSEPGNPLFVAPLLELANDRTKNVRSAVAVALGLIASNEHGREAKMSIQLALGSPDWRVRFAAARAYDYLGDELFDPLVPLLDDPIESVRWAGAATLAARPWSR